MRITWTDGLDRLLRRHYPSGDLDQLALRIGVTRAAVKGRASVLGLHRKNAHKPWTERQLKMLRRHYADMPMEELERKLNRKRNSIYQKAAELGLERSREVKAEQGRKNSRHPKSVAHRFQKGNEPANKGKKEWQFRSPEAIERCRKTQFKPGHRPRNQRDIGTERVHSDGYVYLRTESGCVQKHRYVWEQANGEVPEGCVITFRDGNRQNCSLDNLELISRKESARRTISRETPEARAARIAKTMAKRNEIIRKDRIRIHWGLEPKTKLVKRW